jgi:hypothetical protein
MHVLPDRARSPLNALFGTGSLRTADPAAAGCLLPDEVLGTDDTPPPNDGTGPAEDTKATDTAGTDASPLARTETGLPTCDALPTDVLPDCPLPPKPPTCEQAAQPSGFNPCLLLVAPADVTQRTWQVHPPKLVL